MKGCHYMKLTLETNRLTLRPFKIEDAEDIFKMWANDDEVTKYLTWNSHKSVDDTKYILNLWIKQYEKVERLNFAIVLKEENLLIGGIDVVGYLDNIPVIGYVLSRGYWNNGYMTEACKCLLQHNRTVSLLCKQKRRKHSRRTKSNYNRST